MGEQKEHRVPAVGRGHPAGGSLDLGAPGGRGAHMPDPRRRNHEDAMPGGVHAPTQVEVVAEHRQRGVQPAEGVPDVPAHQGGGRPDGQDVADGVVLTLVVLPAVQARLAVAGAVGRQTHLDQDAGVGPVPHLRAEHRRGRAARGLRQQEGQRVRLDRAVVVQEPHPAGGPGLGETRCHRSTEAGLARQLQHLAVRGPEQGDAVVGGSGVDADQVPGRNGRGSQSRKDVRQPRCPVVGHQDRGHVHRRHGRDPGTWPTAALDDRRRGAGGHHGATGVGGTRDRPAGRPTRRVPRG